MDDFEEALILANQRQKKILDRQRNREQAKRKYATLMVESNTNDDDRNNYDQDDVQCDTVEQLDHKQQSPSKLLEYDCDHIDDEIEIFYHEDIIQTGDNDRKADETFEDEQTGETDMVEEIKDSLHDGPLHLYTDQNSTEFLLNFLRLLRSTNICKSQSEELLKLIRSILREPNNFPVSIKNILGRLNINENLFSKNVICLACKANISSLHVAQCGNCNSTDESTRALVYNADSCTLISMLIHRHQRSIERFNKSFMSTADQKSVPDIPFGRLYQMFLKNVSGNKFINIILHLDGRYYSFDYFKCFMKDFSFCQNRYRFIEIIKTQAMGLQWGFG